MGVERAVTITMSLYPVELAALDDYARHTQRTRSGAVRALMHRAGLINPDSVPSEPPRDLTEPTKSGWCDHSDALRKGKFNVCDRCQIEWLASDPKPDPIKLKQDR